MGKYYLSTGAGFQPSTVGTSKVKWQVDQNSTNLNFAKFCPGNPSSQSYPLPRNKTLINTSVPFKARYCIVWCVSAKAISQSHESLSRFQNSTRRRINFPGTIISHQWERKLIFPTAFGWDYVGSRDGIRPTDLPIDCLKKMGSHGFEPDGRWIKFDGLRSIRM